MEKIKLYEFESNIYSITDFVSKHINNVQLSNREIKILSDNKLYKNSIDDFKVPLSRAKWLKSEKGVQYAYRHGERSAFISDKMLKLKGCNPYHEKRKFPSESMFFGEENVKVTTIPYGILTIDQVIREILGYGFFKKYNLQTNLIPVAVFPIGEGYCIVEKTVSETRIESRFEYENQTIDSLLNLKVKSDLFDLRHGLGREVNLTGINNSFYTYTKALLLVNMNFNGGFRGLLNSNIGNDVINIDEQGNLDLFLCDFDTFKVVGIPEKPDDDFLKRFCLQSYVEVVKSSLPFVHIVDTKEEAVQFYLNNSTIFQAYKRVFLQKVSERGWDVDKLINIENWIFSTPIFKRTVGEIVLSVERIKELPKREPIYKPH
ncbi:MAG: hypothetical protein K8R41_06860 [Bacteroidales bacterium]|nr:hypothetical protein [Bacteroidales bacterium]